MKTRIHNQKLSNKRQLCLLEWLALQEKNASSKENRSASPASSLNKNLPDDPVLLMTRVYADPRSIGEVFNKLSEIRKSERPQKT